MDDIVLSGGARIPERELVWRFDTAGGPGGQHANRSATRVELSFDVAQSSAFDETTKERLHERLGPRMVNGVVVVAASDSRSQWRNRAIARKRLAELLEVALRQAPARRATRPSRAARARRLDAKSRRSAIKRLRRPPDPE